MSMSCNEPLPLKAGGEAAPELVRALYALGRREPGAARLARIAEALGAARRQGPAPVHDPSKLARAKARFKAIALGLVALI